MEFVLTQLQDTWIARFEAMAGPCEIHLCCSEMSEAKRLASLAVSETRRIERKYSRYRNDNVTHTINTAKGRTINLDEETVRLLRFAAQCYDLSEGLFDITSGVLRRAWSFAGGEARPDETLINRLLSRVGWRRVKLGAGAITLETDMEIDLGGMGKEYAVDRAVQLIHEASTLPVMVNFGGDIRVMNPTETGRAWTIGIEDPALENSPLGHIKLHSGAVATSGDSRRYCTYRGRRLGHILNPRTGWPVEGAPRSVTVLDSTCVQAGFLATLAILQGAEAEGFLQTQGVTYHCVR